MFEGPFWEAFGIILGSRSQSKFGHDFGMRFFGLPPLRGDFWGTSGGRHLYFDAHVSLPDPPRAAPLSRAEGSYNDLRIAGS